MMTSAIASCSQVNAVLFRKPLITIMEHSQVRLVTDKETEKSRGYAFVEYAHTRDMKSKSWIANAPCRLLSCA